MFPMDIEKKRVCIKFVLFPFSLRCVSNLSPVLARMNDYEDFYSIVIIPPERES